MDLGFLVALADLEVLLVEDLVAGVAVHGVELPGSNFFPMDFAFLLSRGVHSYSYEL